MRKILNIAIVLLFLYYFFLSDTILESKGEIYSSIIGFVGLLLVIANLYYLFINSETNRIKRFDTITSQNNAEYYLKIWLLLLLTSSENNQQQLSILCLIISLFLLLFSIWVIIKDAIKKKQLITSITIGHALLVFAFYAESKGIYTRHFGNEVIGSFWEKPDYKTKYLVVLKKENSDLVYTQLAQLHVYSETSYYEIDGSFNDNERSQVDKYIVIDTVFFNNGLYLIFGECNLNKSNSCIDQNGELWHISLTNEKVEK